MDDDQRIILAAHWSCAFSQPTCEPIIPTAESEMGQAGVADKLGVVHLFERIFAQPATLLRVDIHQRLLGPKHTPVVVEDVLEVLINIRMGKERLSQICIDEVDEQRVDGHSAELRVRVARRCLRCHVDKIQHMLDTLSMQYSSLSLPISSKDATLAGISSSAPWKYILMMVFWRASFLNFSTECNLKISLLLARMPLNLSM